MAKKKKPSIKPKPIRQHIAEDEDSRPTHSPFASSVCNLYCQESGPLHIPRRFLDKSPKMVSLAAYSSTLYLGDIPLDVGHVLVQFLVTEKYQCLKPQGSSPEEKKAAELKTTLHVYAAAETYQIPMLRTLAKKEMMRLGETMSIISIIQIMEANQTLIQSGATPLLLDIIRPSCQNLTLTDTHRILVELGAPATVSTVLLQILLEGQIIELSLKEELRTATEQLQSFRLEKRKEDGRESVESPETLPESTTSMRLASERDDEPEEEQHNEPATHSYAPTLEVLQAEKTPVHPNEENHSDVDGQDGVVEPAEDDKPDKPTDDLYEPPPEEEKDADSLNYHVDPPFDYEKPNGEFEDGVLEPAKADKWYGVESSEELEEVPPEHIEDDAPVKGPECASYDEIEELNKDVASSDRSESEWDCPEVEPNEKDHSPCGAQFFKSY